MPWLTNTSVVALLVSLVVAEKIKKLAQMDTFLQWSAALQMMLQLDFYFQTQHSRFQILCHIKSRFVDTSCWVWNITWPFFFSLHFSFKGKSFMCNSEITPITPGDIEHQGSCAIVNPFKWIIQSFTRILLCNSVIELIWSVNYQRYCVLSKSKWIHGFRNNWTWRTCKSKVTCTRPIKTHSMLTISTVFINRD